MSRMTSAPVPFAATLAERATVPQRDAAWAARQGTNDRDAGTECRKYSNFLSIYRLPRSPLTLRMWNAYLGAGQTALKNAPRPGGELERPVRAHPRPKPTPAVLGPSWAAHQAREDSISGNVCLSYEGFLRIYGLRTSDAARRVWKVYRDGAKLAPRRTPLKYAQKSNWARGLTLNDASARRGPVRRYDRPEPRRTDLSAENAALLMKVNQQNTLVDMWR